ncbi:MAG: hypothetical protein LVS60_10495 [Nodosilinea sp. LVE1205-7]|jgi:hypothetical protein
MTPKTALPTLIGLTTAIALLTPAAALAITGFTGVYDPSNFTFTPTPSGAGAPGTDLDTSGAPGTIILYSPDNAFNNLGTGLPATIDWTIPITADRAGTISFDWSYKPLDPVNGDDSAFYLLNGTPVPLAFNDGTDQNSLSPISLTVANGDTFGFGVSTQSNDGGSGVFSVSNFDFTPATPVPFESDALPFLVGLSFLGAGVWLKRRHQTVKTLDLSPTEGSEVD